MTYKTIIANTIITGVLLVTFYFALESKKEKMAYVQLGKLYEQFQMKKDLENKYKSVQSARKAILDSMELELSFIYKRLNNNSTPSSQLVNEYETKKEVYFMKKDQFTEDNKQVIEQYTDQIMKKINEYVDQYGKDQDYTFILGADGNGTIMHSKDSKDITDEVLTYINRSYNGNSQ